MTTSSDNSSSFNSKNISDGHGILRSKDEYASYKKFFKDPILLVLLAGVAPILYGTTKAHSAIESLLLGVLLALAASFAGSRATVVWNRIHEQGELIFRGKLSVRSIGLFLRNLERLEARISQLLTRHVKSPASELVVRSYLEEIILSCRGIREEGFSSIENWADLLPEVDGRARLADISALKTKLERLSDSASEVKKELGASKIVGEERESLVKKIAQKQQSQESLENQLVDAGLAYDRSLLSGLQLPAGFASVLSTIKRGDVTEAVVQVPTSSSELNGTNGHH